MCEDYPELRCHCRRDGRKLFYDNRIYYAVLARCPNLFLETHNLMNYLGLDDLVSRFGSQRFLFGSSFPHLDPNALGHAAFTRRDERSETELNIAHRNLDRLMAEVDVP